MRLLLNRSPAVFEILGIKRIGARLELSGSRDVIYNVISRCPTCHFLFMVFWNQGSISNGFRDI